MRSKEAAQRCRRDSHLYVAAIGTAVRRYNKQKSCWEGYNGKDWESVTINPDTSESSTMWDPIKDLPMLNR